MTVNMLVDSCVRLYTFEDGLPKIYLFFDKQFSTNEDPAVNYLHNSFSDAAIHLNDIQSENSYEFVGPRVFDAKAGKVQKISKR